MTWPVLAGGGQSLPLSLETKGPAVVAEVTLAVRTAQDLYRLPASPVDRPGIEQTQAAIEPVYQDNSSVILEPGRKELSFRLPALPAGDYFADVQVKGPAGALDWGTVPLVVQPVCEITRIASEPEVVDLRRTDAGKMAVVIEWKKPTVAKGQTAPHLDKPTLDVAVLDTYDGLLAQSRLKPDLDAGSARAMLALPRPGTSLLKVRVELSAAGQPVAVRTGYVHVIARPWDDYTYFVWAGPGGHTRSASSTARSRAWDSTPSAAARPRPSCGWPTCAASATSRASPQGRTRKRRSSSPATTIRSTATNCGSC